MNLISININGMSDSRKRFWIRSLKGKVKADFIGLQETHLDLISEVEVRRFWDNSRMNFVYVESVGRSGGLMSVWNPDVFAVDKIVKNQRFLLLSGSLSGVSERVNLVNVHAPNDSAQRRRLWTVLAGLIIPGEIWAFFGDFNDVRSEDERVNSIFDRSNSEAFNSFIRSSDLMEYSMVGGKYTYVSGHSTVKMSKLDRFLVNDSFMSVWPDARLEVHLRGFSDHRPITLSCIANDFGLIPFKFFNSWIGDKRLDDIVNSACVSVSRDVLSDKSLADFLKRIKLEIKKWRSEVKKTETSVLNDLLGFIDCLEEKAISAPLSEEEKNKRMDLRVRVDKLESLRAKNYQQKARIKWLKFGDENSSFFSQSGEF